jgi:hypothetical protein
MIDGIVENASINKNLIVVTSKNYCVMDVENLFYRVVACKDRSFSTPSYILSICPEIVNNECKVMVPMVLQNRHTKVNGAEYENDYRDIHVAKEVELPVYAQEEEIAVI